MNKMKKTMALLLSYVLVVAILPMGTLVDVVKAATEIPQYLNYGGGYCLSSTLYKDKALIANSKRIKNPNYGKENKYGNYDYREYVSQNVVTLLESGNVVVEKEFDNNYNVNIFGRFSGNAILEYRKYPETDIYKYNFNNKEVNKIEYDNNAKQYPSFDDVVTKIKEKYRVSEKSEFRNDGKRDIYDREGNGIYITQVSVFNEDIMNSYVGICRNGSVEVYEIMRNQNTYVWSYGYTTVEYKNGEIYIIGYDHAKGENFITKIAEGKEIENYYVNNESSDVSCFTVVGNKIYGFDYDNTTVVEYTLKNDTYELENQYKVPDLMFFAGYTVDVNNNVWIFQDEGNKRFVCKIVNGKAKKKYEVSNIMTDLQVYDDNNLLVISSAGYTHITKKSASDNNNNGGNDNTTEDKNEVVVKPEVNETVDGTTKVEVGTLTSGATNVIEATVGNNVDKVEVTLTDVETIKNGEGAVTVKLNDGNKINLPFSILSDEMLDGAKEVKVEFTAKEDKKITSGLKAVNKVFSFELLVIKEEEQVSIHNFADGEVEVTLALTDEDLKGLDRSKLVVLYYNEETKEYEEMKTVVDGNNVTFKTPHFSKFIVAEKEIISDGESNKEEGTTGNGSGSNNNGSTGTTTGTTNAGSTTTTTNKKPATTSNKLVATGTAASTSVLTMLGLILSGVGATLFVRRK